jgi:hypothetical protein
MTTQQEETFKEAVQAITWAPFTEFSHDRHELDIV